MDQWIAIIIRSISVFILCFLFMRLIGRKNITKGTPFTYIYLTVIAFIAAAISINMVENPILALIGLLVWFMIPAIFDYAALKSKWIHDLLHGKEMVVIKQGKILEGNLIQARLTVDELLRDLRNKNVFDVSDVEFGVLETDGILNVLLKSDRKPLTPKELGLASSPKSEPQTVIMDGNVVYESLSNLGLNQQWLNEQLEAIGLTLDSIFLGQVDSSGDLYVDIFDDSKQVSQPNVKEMVYANLEKVQADLDTYAYQTENQEASTMYSTNAKKLKQLIELLKPYLL